MRRPWRPEPDRNKALTGLGGVLSLLFELSPPLDRGPCRCPCPSTWDRRIRADCSRLSGAPLRLGGFLVFCSSARPGPGTRRVEVHPRIGRTPEMDLFRRKALRAASLILILAALAVPAYAANSPIFNWTPNGTESGDPDVGGDYQNFRHLHHVLLFISRRIMTPTVPIVSPVPNTRSAPSSVGPKR